MLFGPIRIKHVVFIGSCRFLAYFIMLLNEITRMPQNKNTAGLE